MKKGLGRGFDSLIPVNLIDETFDPTAKQDVKLSKLQDLALTSIEPDPDQPRKFFDEDALAELSDSVEQHGVVQPIVVTRKGEKYIIVAGERRWRAAKMAGLEKIPSIIRSLTDQHRLEISLIENLQRRDLNALETATAYLKLRDQFNMTLEEIGHRVGGKSVSAVSNTLRLLKLPKAVQQAIFEGRLSEGQARPLVGLEPKLAEKLMERAIDEGWSVRKMEQMIVLLKQSDKQKSIPQSSDIPYATAVGSLAKKLDAKIRVRTNAKGAGQIVIKFKDQQDFDRISQLLG